MDIIIFGSTGNIGNLLIKQGLEEGHKITAFARDPSKISLSHERLNMVEGDVLQRTSVDSAVAGHDAVIIVLGAGMKGGVRAQGTLNIINAMQTHKVKRLVCQSTLGAGDSRGNLNFFWKYIMFGGLLRGAYADHELQEKYIHASGLDWTIVRPGAFTDDEFNGEYRHGFSASDKSTQLKISKSDVAEFLLKQLSDLRYLHQSPGLSY
jgi:putative NADH-flavin reductase